MKKANDLLYGSNFQEAIQEYDKILNSNPDKDTILAANYNKAQAYDGLGQYSAAASCY
jgi:tetratricopeptide (TPR) repeat protein